MPGDTFVVERPADFDAPLWVYGTTPARGLPDGIDPWYALGFPADRLPDGLALELGTLSGGGFRPAVRGDAAVAKSRVRPVVAIEGGTRETRWHHRLMTCRDCNVPDDWAFTGMAVQAVVQVFRYEAGRARGAAGIMSAVGLTLLAVRPVGDLADDDELRARINGRFEEALSFGEYRHGV